VQAAGHLAIPVPGASSVVAALSVAGDTAGAGFVFIGFLPQRGGERALALNALAASNATQVLFEAPHRIEALAAALAQVCGSRALTLCRELTKQFENVATMAADALPAWIGADAKRVRGEFVLVLHATPATVTDDEASAHDSMLRILLADLPLKQAVSLTAELTGAPRNALYARALALKAASAD
jgi:16S rRNA (cytidine1402-2'-O)-methyltransferase